MKKFIFLIVLFILLFVPLYQSAAQAQSATQSQSAAQSSSQADENSSESLVFFDTTGFPQWAKDLRRFDIIAFGTFPFSLFFFDFFVDMYRWNNANGMDFSTAGRAYAPWPLRSAGGVDKTSAEFRNTIIMAASLSIVLAVVDLIIYKYKQKKELERVQSIPPSGSYTIIRNTDETVEPEPDESDPGPAE